MSKPIESLLKIFAERLGMGDGEGLLETLKATAFKPAKVNGQYVAPTDAQLTALLVVANQYGLNPWTKEIYAFPDKQGGIVPVVGVDGWSRIINTNVMYDGVEFTQDADSCACTIWRKDRTHPTTVTEWMVECRGTMGPWLTHPYRMLRHKALIQCARLAFGFVGIYDLDEAERIMEAHGEYIENNPTAAPVKPMRASEKAALTNAPTEPVMDLNPVVPTAAVEQVPVATVAQVPAPTPAPAPAAPAATGEPASAGECMNVIVTAKAKKVNLEALMAEKQIMGLDPATMTGMTKAQFKMLKGAM